MIKKNFGPSKFEKIINRDVGKEGWNKERGGRVQKKIKKLISGGTSIRTLIV